MCHSCCVCHIRYLESEAQNVGFSKVLFVWAETFSLKPMPKCVCASVCTSAFVPECVCVHRMTEGHAGDELANIISLPLIGRLP